MIYDLLFRASAETMLTIAGDPKQAVEDLNALGLKYRLVGGESPAGNKGVAKTQQKGQAEKKSAARPAG